MTFKRILASVLGICFIAFAAMQYNDPDAAPWIATYLAAAIFSFLVVFNRISRTLLLLAFVAFAVGAVVFWPEKWEGLAIGGGDIRNIEEARESLGLAICSLAMLVFAFLSSSRTRLHPPHNAPHSKKWAN
jgi:hypothetical protein